MSFKSYEIDKELANYDEELRMGDYLNNLIESEYLIKQSCW